jgi:DNA-directed RNA polymerase specialized sigma24 family protein
MFLDIAYYVAQTRALPTVAPGLISAAPDRYQRVTEESTSETERAAETACKAQDHRAAIVVVMQAYGTEIYSFLLAQFRGDAGSADEVFSGFTEDLWRGLPKFQWRCSIRAWCYKLARTGVSRFRRAPHNKANRRVALSEAPFLDELVQPARTSTRPHLRTDVKDKFEELREKLSPEDRDLLILRVDRNLPWRDIAFAMQSADQMPEDEQSKKLEAALRQRFAGIKERLKRLAQEAGLI